MGLGSESSMCCSVYGNSPLTQGSPKCIASLAVAFLQSTLRFQADPSPFPFQLLPPELRLQICQEALSGAVYDGIIRSRSITVTQTRNKPQLRFDNPIKGESRGINVGLLAANKLVSNEAVAVLYQQRIFNFTTNVHSVVPFLSSLSDQARQNLHGVTMELHDKSEPDYCCGFTVRSIGVRDRGVQAAWSKACVYIADNVTVNTLFLTINVKIPAEFRSLTWVEDLVKIKKLKSLMLHANQHLNSGPVLIKASYKEGSVSATDHCDSEHLVPFFEYLREEMLE